MSDNTLPVEPDDATLIRRYAEFEDGEALDTLFRRHADFAYQIACRFLNNASEAEDVVQAAFLRVMRDAKTYRGGAGVKVWIMKIVVSACRTFVKSAVRRRRREKIRAEEDEWLAMTAKPAQDGVAEEWIEGVRKALERLPSKYRMPIWLHHYEGMPYRDVSRILDVTEGTLRAQAKRGLTLLRANLARTGLVVPSAMILPSLRSVSLSPAPVRLTRTLSALSRTAQAALPVDARPRSLPSVRIRAVGVAGLAVAGGLAAAVWIGRSDRTPANPMPVPVADPMRYGEMLAYWHFDAPDATQGLHVVDGEWRHVAQSGWDGSGGMEIVSDLFQVVLPEFPRRFPIEISYRARPLLTQAFHRARKTKGLDTVVFASWTPHRMKALFHGLGDAPNFAGDAGPWRRVVEYATEDFVYMEIDGKPHSLMLQKPLPASRLSVMARGRFHLDDLTVRAIASEQVPDLSRYFEAIESVPPDKRKGTVALPHIEPGLAQKQVTVRFYD